MAKASTLTGSPAALLLLGVSGGTEPIRVSPANPHYFEGDGKGLRGRAKTRHPARASAHRCRVAFGRGKIPPQFLRRAARSVARRVALYPPSLSERARVDRVEAELVQQMRDRLLGRRVIAGDHQRATILRARRLSMRGELGRVDVIESLHDH